MKNIIIAILIVTISACSSISKETKIAVSTLLDEIQFAVNVISKQTKNSSLPPFKSAELTLSTVATRSKDGSVSLILSGGGGKSTINTNIITLELVPNSNNNKMLSKGSGRDIANLVIAAIEAVDAKKHLKLNTLNVESGLIVTTNKDGGIDVELAGFAIKGKSSVERSSVNNLKLTFAYPKKA